MTDDPRARFDEGDAIQEWNRRGVAPGPDLIYLLLRIMRLEEELTALKDRSADAEAAIYIRPPTRDPGGTP